ncbi:DUF5677 domain-containing protein [Actinoplanes sp. G11-F43]|uniref:DUF5677 domain-containing protein n=1 Tax=Actinoplanes sp. G11-F43 TaxID=3424130 RepID=UPI003D3563D3
MSRKGKPHSLPVEVYRETVDELLSAWDRFEGFDTRTKDLPIARVVFALTANAHSSARAAVTLWDADLWVESMPIVRSCFESAVMAAWTQQTGKSGVEATLFERTRQSVNMMRTADQALVAVPQDLRDHITARHDSAPRPSRAAQARNFERMCADLEAGNSLYLMYRHASDVAHASSALTRHLVPGQRDSLIQVKEPAPSSGTQAVAGLTVAYALVWAGRAFMEVGLSKPGKQALRKIAMRLGISPILVAHGNAKMSPPR